MIYRRTLSEALHLLTGTVAIAAMFGAAAWVYPQGYFTIWGIGFVTIAAVTGMSIPEFRKAWAADRNDQGNGLG